MFAPEISYDSFLPLFDDTTVAQARSLLADVSPLITHIVIIRPVGEDGPTYHYLFSIADAHQRLDYYRNEPDLPLLHAFNLHEYTATMAVSPATPAENVPDHAVLQDEQGQVTGFYDAHLSPSEATRLGTDLTPTTHQLQAELPAKLTVGETHSLLVSLAGLAGQRTETPALPLALPVGSVVDVVVQSLENVVLVGRAEGQLTLSPEPGDSLPLQFKVQGMAVGPASLRVLAFTDGQPLGQLPLYPQVVAAQEIIATQRQTQPVPQLTVSPPDLSLLILERPLPQQGGVELTFHLTTADQQYRFKRFGPVMLSSEPARYIQEMFRDIEQNADWLRAEGTALYEQLFPLDLRVLLWELHGRVQQVQIITDDPWIPWEMCVMTGEEQGQIIEGHSLAWQFPLTRWATDFPAQQLSLPLQRMAVVATPGQGLTMPMQEQANLLGWAKGERQVEKVTSSYTAVRQALGQGIYDGWHFAGHANSNPTGDANRAYVVLSDGKLRPQDLSGVTRNFGRAKPFVFLNACRSGQSGLSLSGLGGFARAFLGAGATAFIGTHWSVADDSAAQFAEIFYEGLLGEKLPLGEAVRQARQAVRRRGDTSWLAYTVYGHPLARVV